MKDGAFSIRSGDALIVIDPQNDFCPGGTLAVGGGDAIMPGINALAANFPTIVVTQDWHPAGHSSFASSHPSSRPFDTIRLPYGEQVLWPDHCIQGSPGAAFHADIGETIRRAALIVRKGYNPDVDSYSAFFENDKTTRTGLAGFLRDKRVTRCVFVGLAYDFCVAWSALDAVREGFEAVVLKDHTRAIGMPLAGGGTTVSEAEERFAAAGVALI
ncbi:bifunctional nicotinamidase/pyrazinamidase [Sphingomonas sp. S2-65]|uniref:bifunctional nicotinamidase/pyrazinamidase n=1 Tax=Sphingomonas sp. S2-65 TaxID=2903960 RepID=UPI001F2A0875|nr:bifunctional nicotinamidase/pyrazinamidase [Sphingomonas sp. S2-65]UYY60195.1 bifunctional nicotinamidase/pyrazinamidase [Sphingomonas sp. S2-65]